MNYLVENMTRAPSQVLVRSASTFGEEAAKVLGKILEESLKNCTNDITQCVKESTGIASKKVGKAVQGFGQTFKETGVEGFTEWGIGIERAFYHLGQKIETGLTNSTGRFTSSVQDTIQNSLETIDGTIKQSTHHVTDSLSQQVPAWKRLFQKELIVVLVCLVLLSLAVFMWSLSVFLSLFSAPSTPYYYYPPQVIGKGGEVIQSTYHNHRNATNTLGGVPPIVHIANILIYLLFASLVGYAIYVWSTKQSTSNSTPSTPSKTYLSPSKEHKHKRTLSPSTDEVSQILDSPKVFLLIVGCFGFFAGNVGNQLSYSFNLVLLIVILLIVVLLIYKSLAFNLIYVVYKRYKRYQEFCKWETQNTTKPVTVEQKQKTETIAAKPRRFSTVATATEVSQTIEVQTEAIMTDEELQTESPLQEPIQLHQKQSKHHHNEEYQNIKKIDADNLRKQLLSNTGNSEEKDNKQNNLYIETNNKSTTPTIIDPTTATITERRKSIDTVNIHVTAPTDEPDEQTKPKHFRTRSGSSPAIITPIHVRALSTDADHPLL
jgi:hypothetical protein